MCIGINYFLDYASFILGVFCLFPLFIRVILRHCINNMSSSFAYISLNTRITNGDSCGIGILGLTASNHGINGYLVRFRSFGSDTFFSPPRNKHSIGVKYIAMVPFHYLRN